MPKVLNSSEINEKGKYIDPLCKAQANTDAVDGGWVYCPMIHNKLIALGCCIEAQTVALSSDFHKALDFEIFGDAQLLTSLPLTKLRAACLEHQVSLIIEELSKTDDKKDKEELNQLLSEIRQLLDGIEHD